MSNIIDGIDYGMGYEPTTEYAPNIEWWDKGDNTWSETCWSSQESLAVEIARHGTVYRRPLPIISQHPGAIPLEPGEELVEGECYLMRDGRLTGPMPFDGHEAFPFGLDGTPDTWRRDGTCWKNSLSHNDIVARLPKVEEERVQVGTLFPKLSELAKAVLENPKIMIEVERQRKEREIGEGDWVRHKRDALIFKVQFADDRHKTVLYPNGVYHYGMENLEKIHDPAFIAFLEKGSQP